RQRFGTDVVGFKELESRHRLGLPPSLLDDVQSHEQDLRVRARSRKAYDYAAFKACAISAVRSDGCSMPIDNRIVELRIPILWRMSVGTPERVMLAGRLASDS